MIVVRETSKWAWDFMPNHVYVLSDDKRKLHAYATENSAKVTKFDPPLNFDARNRTFKILRRNVNGL